MGARTDTYRRIRARRAHRRPRPRSESRRRRGPVGGRGYGPPVWVDVEQPREPRRGLRRAALSVAAVSGGTAPIGCLNPPAIGALSADVMGQPCRRIRRISSGAPAVVERDYPATRVSVDPCGSPTASSSGGSPGRNQETDLAGQRNKRSQAGVTCHGLNKLCARWFRLSQIDFTNIPAMPAVNMTTRICCAIDCASEVTRTTSCEVTRAAAYAIGPTTPPRNGRKTRPGTMLKLNRSGISLLRRSLAIEHDHFRRCRTRLPPRSGP